MNIAYFSCTLLLFGSRMRSAFVASLAALLLIACGGSVGTGDPGEASSAAAAADRGALIEGAPIKIASYTPTELVGLLDIRPLAQLLTQSFLDPDCAIDVFQLKYWTVAPGGNLTPASGALMTPNGPGASCLGPRPVLLYAHGTNTDRSFNIADLQNPDNGEGLLIAAALAAEGYIVIAPNYVGYDTSTLSFHPYLNADQQSKDMIDALAAARSALPTSSAPNTTDGGKLFVTGYSQGGYVAMATHRAMQAEGITVTASAPMSGPYALSAFGDAIFQGQVSGGAPVNLTLLLSSYQHTYGNIYVRTTDAFEAQYAMGIDSLLPSTTPVSELRNQGRLPQSAVFDNTPPDPAFASMTPATAPANLAPVFAIGFGPDHLLTNSFRLGYLQDAQRDPDRGFPVLVDNQPPANPANPLRRALKLNDQRNWTPVSPMLLCAGNADPVVFYLNTSLMQNFWVLATNVTVVDIDSGIAIGDPFTEQKAGFAVAENIVDTNGGQEAVLAAYHTALVAPFCLSAVKMFFDER